MLEKIKSGNFRLLDTETTAFVHQNGRLVELAIIEVRKWQIVDKLHFLIKAPCRITSGAAGAHKIKDEDLEHCPRFSEIEPEVTEHLSDGLPVLGYNCDKFDKLIIDLEYQYCKKPTPNIDWVDIYKLVCEMISYEDVERKTSVRSRSQTNIAKYFNIDATGAHRALADVKVLLEIVKKLHSISVEEAHKIEKTLLSVDKLSGSVDKLSDTADKITVVKIPSGKLPADFIKRKDDAIKAITKANIEKSVAMSISDASALSSEIILKIREFAKIKVVDDATAEAAAKAILWFSTKRKLAVKLRTNSTKSIKNVSKLIDGIFKSWVTDPATLAENVISERRSRFLLKKHESASELASERKRHITEMAEQTSTDVFNKTKEESGTDAAVLKSNEVYEEIMEIAAQSVVNVVTETTLEGKSKIIDTIEFTIEIIDKDAIPKKWLTPDIDAITKFVNETAGEIPINGVAITTVHKSKISNR